MPAPLRESPAAGTMAFPRTFSLKKGVAMAGIPVLMAEGDCIARAWENALVLLHASGCDIKTQYDKPDDPPSKDATMIVTIADPLAEPMIHRDFPGGFEELQEYVMEVCDGSRTTASATRTTPPTPAGNTPTISGCSSTRPPRCRRSIRSSSSARSWRPPRTRGGRRRSPGRCGKTTPATTRPACRASGAGSPSRTIRRC